MSGFAAKTNEKHQERIYKIELLFDSKRPCLSKGIVLRGCSKIVYTQLEQIYVREPKQSRATGFERSRWEGVEQANCDTRDKYTENQSWQQAFYSPCVKPSQKLA